VTNTNTTKTNYNRKKQNSYLICSTLLMMHNKPVRSTTSALTCC